MLRRTFLHLYGVGETTERRWWGRGLRDWTDYLAAADPPGPPAARAENRRRITESLDCWERAAWGELNRRLPQISHWRAYGDLGARALYVDIETTGDGLNEITVIGTYDGTTCKTFVAGRNLDEALREIDQYPLLVTFNGACFDLPIIRGHFRGEPINAFHIDLMYPLRRLGLRGGLKRIEQTLGIARPSELDGLSGWDAVRLLAGAPPGFARRAGNPARLQPRRHAQPEKGDGLRLAGAAPECGTERLRRLPRRSG